MGSRVSAQTGGIKTLSLQAAIQAACSDKYSQERDETQQEQERRHLHYLSQCQSQTANAAVADEANVLIIMQSKHSSPWLLVILSPPAAFASLYPK